MVIFSAEQGLWHDSAPGSSSQREERGLHQGAGQPLLLLTGPIWETHRDDFFCCIPSLDTAEAHSIGHGGLKPETHLGQT